MLPLAAYNPSFYFQRMFAASGALHRDSIRLYYFSNLIEPKHIEGQPSPPAVAHSVFLVAPAGLDL